ncbi:MAG: hypothetical protein K6E18_06405 [Lachnospiraceae bacterium]|nr:hypothetical protein [Lachnospiraceae bacterium]
MKMCKAGKGKTCQKKGKMRESGAAMIVVVCVMAVVMILSLTILVSTYQMLATVADEGRDEMYYRQVLSFSAILQKEIEEYSNTGVTSPLVTYINSFIADESEGAPQKIELVAPPPASGGAYAGLDIVLDKGASAGSLVVTISADDESTPVASCSCKYEISGSPSALKYKFRGYYQPPTAAQP